MPKNAALAPYVPISQGIVAYMVPAGGLAPYVGHNPALTTREYII